MANKKVTRRALTMSIISLILCCAMLVGTTFAWFTDEVTSTGNIIKSGNLDVEMWYSNNGTSWADASSGPIFNHEHWEPGYTDVKYIEITNKGSLAFKFQLNIVSNMTPVAGEANLADVIDVYLLEGTVNRAAVDAARPVGTLSQLMAETDGAAHGVMLPADGMGSTNHADAPADAITGSKQFTIVLKMQETAGNEYQNLSVGEGFSVQLLATQYTWENDSFDHTYDNDAAYNGAPVAKVTKATEFDNVKIENLPVPLYTYGNFSATGKTQDGLDVGFVFETTETAEEAAAGEYANWHADFVVSFDNAIATGTAGLAGQYDFWGAGWVGFEAFDVDSTDSVDGIPANLACRLLEGKGVYIGYADLCKEVKEFNCGVFDIDGANSGTTITVELRLYETYTEEECEELFGYKSVNEETGHSITIGTYTYTFE